jgi:hypothetical protein
MEFIALLKMIMGNFVYLDPTIILNLIIFDLMKKMAFIALVKIIKPLFNKIQSSDIIKNVEYTRMIVVKLLSYKI